MYFFISWLKVIIFSKAVLVLKYGLYEKLSYPAKVPTIRMKMVYHDYHSEHFTTNNFETKNDKIKETPCTLVSNL